MYNTNEEFERVDAILMDDVMKLGRCLSLS